MTEQLRTESGSFGVRFVVDNNFFPLRRSRERVELMDLHKAGRIQLALVDVTGTEWLDAPPDMRRALEAEAAELHEYHGPLVLGHSRLGHAVLGSELDSRFLDEVVNVHFREPGATGSLRAIFETPCTSLGQGGTPSTSSHRSDAYFAEHASFRIAST